MPEYDLPTPGAADIRFYREHGYWLAPRILSDEALESLRDHLARVVAGEYETARLPLSRSPEAGEPADKIVQVNNAYWTDSVISRLALSPVIGAMAAALTGAKAIRLWHDQLLFKPPQSGESGQVGWHQDYGYWQCAEPAQMLTAWVALDDVDEENGCMKVVPGSHRWGLIPEGDFYDQNLAGLEERIEAAAGRKLEPVPCILPAGSLSFHHCMTLHGSGPNRSLRPRRSLVIHLLPEGTRYRAGTPNEGHVNVRLLSGRDGDPFAGPFFPVLYRRDSVGAWEIEDGAWTATE
ncbi:MAG: phytanoyl-CoA dioxygenase family protein [Armatimonadetes bacterium]|nr:phytanoyl-CoA dioxygenase family protein [Armatimonadota bacterium]